MTVKVGMIGAGGIVNEHCGAMAKYNEVEVIAVADLSRERREAAMEKFSIPKGYETWEELVADPEIDGVAIALPNVLHAPASIAALEAGKHVLLDKPFALNYGEAKEIADTAERVGKVLMLGMNQRYRPDAQITRAIVDRGDLGEIFHAKACWLRRAGSPKFGTWFVNKAMSGGGCMLDIGVHFLDLALHLMGNWEPVSVTGQVYSKFGHRGIGEGGWGRSDKDESIRFDVDDSAMALIKFSNRATLELNISWVLHQETGNKSNVELYGTDAGMSMAPTKIFRHGKNPGEYEVVEPQNVQIPHRYQSRQANWLDAIRGIDQPLCKVEESLTVQRILDGIYESSETGNEARLD